MSDSNDSLERARMRSKSAPFLQSEIRRKYVTFVRAHLTEFSEGKTVQEG